MDSEDPARHNGGPRRVPGGRSGNRQPAPRRASGRMGSPRRAGSAQPKRAAPRSERSGGRPRPQEDEGFPRPDGPSAAVPTPRRGERDARPRPAPQRGKGKGAKGHPDVQPDDRFAVPHEVPREDTRGGRPGRKAGPRSGKNGKKPKKRPAKPARGRSGARPGGPAAGRSGPGAKLYFGAAAALGVILVVVAGVAFLGGGGKGKSAPQTPSAALGTPGGSGYSPTSYSSSPSSAAYERVAARSGDSAPLTIGEAFPGSAASIAVPEGTARLTLRAKRLDVDCGAAVWGQTVWAGLNKGGCTQAVRGLYADTKRGYGLSVTVFNLAASADADRLVDTLGGDRGGGFVRPLRADAPLDRFGQGFGMARGLAMGHYAVIAWAQRLDGKGDEKDETLLSLLIEGGKPPGVLGRAAGAN